MSLFCQTGRYLLPNTLETDVLRQGISRISQWSWGCWDVYNTVRFIMLYYNYIFAWVICFHNNIIYVYSWIFILQYSYRGFSSQWLFFVLIQINFYFYCDLFLHYICNYLYMLISINSERHYLSMVSFFCRLLFIINVTLLYLRSIVAVYKFAIKCLLLFQYIIYVYSVIYYGSKFFILVK